MGLLISISGVDCAGKSTHIALLRQYFASTGRTYCVLWYRPGYSPALGALKSVVRRVTGLGKTERSGLPQNGRPATTGRRMRTGFPDALWMATALADSVFEWGCVLRTVMARYDVVICDRYVWDGVLDLKFRSKLGGGWPSGLLSSARRLFPTPDYALLLTLPYDTMVLRAELKNEPFPDSPEVRAARWEAYTEFASDGQMVGIDASGPVYDTHRAILYAIGEN